MCYVTSTIFLSVLLLSTGLPLLFSLLVLFSLRSFSPSLFVVTLLVQPPPLLCQYSILSDALLLSTSVTLHSYLCRSSPYRSSSAWIFPCWIFTDTPTTLQHLLFFFVGSSTISLHHCNSLCSLPITLILSVEPLLKPLTSYNSNSQSL